MAHLLNVQRLKSKAMQRKSNVPLILEFRVNAETAPYLVSSSSGVMWIDDPHPNNIVKSAIRQVGLDAFFSEVVEAVIVMGRQMQWGNIQPLTSKGLRDAIDHVEFYDLGPVELLIPRAHKKNEDLSSSSVPWSSDDWAGEEDLSSSDKIPWSSDDIDEPMNEDEEGEAHSSARRVDPVDLMPPELRVFIEEAGLPFRPSSWVPDNTIVVVPRDRSYVGHVSKVTAKKIAAVVHNAARGIAIVQGVPSSELAG